MNLFRLNITQSADVNIYRWRYFLYYLQPVVGEFCIDRDVLPQNKTGNAVSPKITYEAGGFFIPQVLFSMPMVHSLSLFSPILAHLL